MSNPARTQAFINSLGGDPYEFVPGKFRLEGGMEISEKPDPEYAADKGVPYRQLRKRALYLLEDFSDAECEVVLKRLVRKHPKEAAEAICGYWEDQIEGRKSDS